MNILKYGLNAPKKYEQIWIDPLEVSRLVNKEEIEKVTGNNRNDSSGMVIDWNQIENTVPLTSEFRIQYCFKHWKEGSTWDEIGVFDYMSRTEKYRSWPLQKIKDRFIEFDRIFDQVKKDNRLKSRKEIYPENYREKGGIMVHVARNGEIFFAGIGFHRLAMSQILELEKIPACIGVVDKHAIKYLDSLRKN